MISPYSVRLMVDSHEHSGHMAGLLFFVSTIGSAGGTLATSFYFVLWFDVNQILWGAVAVLLLVRGPAYATAAAAPGRGRAGAAPYAVRASAAAGRVWASAAIH